MLVVVFDSELKAYEGSKALADLDSEGSISIHAQAVIEKIANGEVSISHKGGDFPVRTVEGTGIGALIGLLGGPIGLFVGAVTGTLAGRVWDLNSAGVNSEFLDDLSDNLTAGKWAIVSDVSEDEETPVDTRMATLGGTVFRTTRHDVMHEQDAKRVADLKAEIALLKDEQAKSRKEQKATIQLKIDSLNEKVNAKLDQAKQRSKQQQKEAKAKVAALEKKAAKAKGEAKAKIEAWIDDIKNESKKSKETFDQLQEEG